MNKTKKPNNPKIEAEHLAAILMKAEYLDKKSFYFHSFVRGLMVGAGSVIGATVLIALLLWILSLFDTFPFIGPIIDNATDTIQDQK